MHEVLVNRLEGLSLARKSVVRLTDHPDMTLDVYRGRKTTIQQHTTTKQKLVYCGFNILNVPNYVSFCELTDLPYCELFSVFRLIRTAVLLSFNT